MPCIETYQKVKYVYSNLVCRIISTSTGIVDLQIRKVKKDQINLYIRFHKIALSLLTLSLGMYYATKENGCLEI